MTGLVPLKEVFSDDPGSCFMRVVGYTKTNPSL